MLLLLLLPACLPAAVTSSPWQGLGLNARCLGLTPPLGRASPP